MLDLNRKDLFRQEAFVGGAWYAGRDEAFLTVINPADGSLVGRVPALGAEDVTRAVDAAEAALRGFRKWTAKERGAVLQRWAALMMHHKRDLARIMTAEQGKPLGEAIGEIEYAASFLEWFGEEAKRCYGDTIPANRADQRITVIRQPVGVCAAITPWNFPSAMITRKLHRRWRRAALSS